MSAVAEAIHAPSSTKDSALAASTHAKALFDLVQKKPFPVFKQTLQRLGRFHNKPNSSIPKIVSTLRLDPCYSHQVFLKANAGLVKNNRQPASSLDHAILVLGVPQVITIGKQLPLISELENSSQKFRIIQTISSAYHAGVQARELMSDLGRNSTETAFISAQLHNIYLAGLWFYAPEEMSKMLKASQHSSLFSKEAVLTEVGKMLSKKWYYSELIQQSLEPQPDSSRLVKTVAFAKQVAQLSENGWYSQPMDKLIAQSSKTLGIPEGLLCQSTHRNSVIAARESAFYPIKPAAYRLVETNRSETNEISVVKTPSALPKKKKIISEENIQTKQIKPSTKALQKEKMTVAIKKPTSNSLNLQLKVLSEMGHKKRPPQEILSFSFKLISKLSEKSVAVFFLLDPGKTSLKSRFINNVIDQKKMIVLPIRQKNIFQLLMKNQQSVWVNKKNRSKYSKLLPAEFPIQISDMDFVAMSLFIQEKPIGLFYLESSSDKPLSSNHYQQFVSICKTTSTSLEEVKRHAK